jgi:hypothetical protein
MLSNEFHQHVNEFSLYNVISDRYMHPKDGYQSCSITLTEAHKLAFVESLGQGVTAKTLKALQSYIEAPKDYTRVNKALGSWLERITWHSDFGFSVTWGHDCPIERNAIRKMIRENV